MHADHNFPECHISIRLKTAPSHDKEACAVFKRPVLQDPYRSASAESTAHVGTLHVSYTAQVQHLNLVKAVHESKWKGSKKITNFIEKRVHCSPQCSSFYRAFYMFRLGNRKHEMLSHTNITLAFSIILIHQQWPLRPIYLIFARGLEPAVFTFLKVVSLSISNRESLMFNTQSHAMLSGELVQEINVS